MPSQFTVMTKPVRRLAFVVALVLPSTVHGQLDIEFDVAVTEVDGLFRYDYTLRNLVTSSVGLNGFLMTVGQDADILNMAGPENWSPFYEKAERNLQVAWLADAEEFDIQPEMDAMFSLSSSFAPDPQEYFIAKFTADFGDILAFVEGSISAPSIPPMTTLDCNEDSVINADDLACACGIGIRDELLAELTLIEGDLDGDGQVAFADFLVLSSNFGTAVDAYPEGDIDCDGLVAFADFLVLSANFGRQSDGVAAAAVPEPAGLLSVGISCCFLATRRRRRRTDSVR